MNIKEYKNYILRNEYDEYVKLIDELRRHIHHLSKNNNITVNDKNVYLNELFEVLKQLNTIYNSAVVLQDVCKDMDSQLQKLYNDKKFDLLFIQISVK